MDTVKEESVWVRMVSLPCSWTACQHTGSNNYHETLRQIYPQQKPTSKIWGISTHCPKTKMIRMKYSKINRWTMIAYKRNYYCKLKRIPIWRVDKPHSKYGCNKKLHNRWHYMEIVKLDWHPPMLANLTWSEKIKS